MRQICLGQCAGQPRGNQVPGHRVVKYGVKRRKWSIVWRWKCHQEGDALHLADGFPGRPRTRTEGLGEEQEEEGVDHGSAMLTFRRLA